MGGDPWKVKSPCPSSHGFAQCNWPFPTPTWTSWRRLYHCERLLRQLPVVFGKSPHAWTGSRGTTSVGMHTGGEAGDDEDPGCRRSQNPFRGPGGVWALEMTDVLGTASQRTHRGHGSEMLVIIGRDIEWPGGPSPRNPYCPAECLTGQDQDRSACIPCCIPRRAQRHIESYPPHGCAKQGAPVARGCKATASRICRVATRLNSR